MRLVFLTLGIIFMLNAAANRQIDSLARLAENAGVKDQAGIYLRIVRETIQDSATSNFYNRKAYQLAVANHQPAELAKSVFYSGKICVATRNFPKAIKYFEKAIPLFQQLNDTVDMTTCWSYIGIANFNMSKSKEAIAAYLEGLKLAQRDPDYSAELLANIGLVHDEMDNFDAAISYYKKAVTINQSIRDLGSLAIDYDYLGAAYARMEMPDSALVYYRKALSLFRKTGKDDRYAVTLSNLATVLPNYPDSLEKAIGYFNVAWEQFQKLGWNYYEPDIKQGIADVLVKEGKLDQAIALYRTSLNLAFKYKRELLIKKTIYKHLAEAYQKAGDFKQALENHILYGQYNDSVFQTEKFEQIAILEKQYETERKENEIIQLQSKQELTDMELQKNKQLKILGFVLTSLLLVFVFFMLARYYDKAKMTQLLESKNRTIEKSENDLRIMNAAKNKFFSIIAHDLKNPFHTVMGYSDLLDREYEHFTEKERRSFARNIAQSSNKIYQLLQNLLEWSRSQTGRLDFSPGEVNLDQLVSKAVSILQPQADQKHIHIELNFDKKLVIFADPLMIETVLRNLLNNAIKFTPENGQIELSAIEKGDYVEICVKDTGIGISESDVATLFRIDSTIKRKGTGNEDGTGLGLILCKEFVQKNHGDIRVDTAPGKGSSFFILIPAKASPDNKPQTQSITEQTSILAG